MIQNPEIAAIFDAIADCLEIRSGNPFRIRAYRNAARLLQSLPQPAARLLAESAEKLEELPGIGKDLSGKIRTIVETGTLPLYEEVCRRIPPGLRAMMGIPGLGPKRALRLHEALGVASLDELKRAAFAHRIRSLAGFGEKTETAILQGIESLESTQRRYSLREARAYADELTRRLKQAPGLRRIAVAGSYRRRRETVGDLDILVVCRDTDAVMDALVTYGKNAKVLARGDTKLSVRLENGLQIDLRVVPDAAYGAALQYFTGSQAHGVELRERAQSRQLKLSEYGVFRGSRRVAGRTEEEVYAALGLPWIPPELREGRGEIALAARRSLPKLVELDDIRGDLHLHTTATDGRASLEEMVRAAKERGYRYVAITDHSQRVTVARGLTPARIRKEWKKIDALRAKERGISILKGVELDILDDGSLDLPDDVLAEADWVIASLHYGHKQSRDRITRRLLGAIRNPYVKAIAHPTGRLIGTRPPYDVDLDAVMRAAADRNVALELNGQPERLDLNDLLARAARDRGVPIVVDSDAHSVPELANMEWGVAQARRAGLEAGDVINTRSLDGLLGAVKRAA